MRTAIHPAAFVNERAQLGVGVIVEPGALIGPQVKVGDRTRIGSHTLLTGWTTIGHDCKIHHGAVLGSPPLDLKYSGEISHLEIGDHTEVREYVTANLATEAGGTTRVGSHCLLMAYVHVAHDCSIGDHVIVANSVQMGGYVTIEDWAIVGGGSVVHQFVRIGGHSLIGGGSRVIQDVAPYIKAAGNPPRLGGVNTVGLERRGFSRETRAALVQAYRILYREHRTVPDAVTTMRQRIGDVPEVEHLARFAETSVRGLVR